MVQRPFPASYFFRKVAGLVSRFAGFAGFAGFAKSLHARGWATLCPTQISLHLNSERLNETRKARETRSLAGLAGSLIPTPASSISSGAITGLRLLHRCLV
jgi:hypothetical protein